MENKICPNCNNVFFGASNKKYCCKKCRSEYRYKIFKESGCKKPESYVVKKCEICGDTFRTKSRSSRFCSRKCQGVWQSLTLIGENANRYENQYSNEDREFVCACCGKKYFVMPSRFGNTKYCSVKCQKKSMIKTLTKPHISIDNLLCKSLIQFENEKEFGNYFIDIYLPKYNLCIEIMGDYFHYNPYIYSSPKNDLQSKSRVKDKLKHDYIYNNYGINTLYLWENDINNNIELCNLLILKYVQNNGEIENYHSFNYTLTNKEICLKKEIINIKY